MNAASRGNAYYESNKKDSEKGYGGIEGNKNNKSYLDDINAYINYLERMNMTNSNNLILKKVGKINNVESEK